MIVGQCVARSARRRADYIIRASDVGWRRRAFRDGARNGLRVVVGASPALRPKGPVDGDGQPVFRGRYAARDLSSIAASAVQRKCGGGE